MSKHGTYSMYNQGCRCKACTKAKAAYVKAWRTDRTRRLLDAEPYRQIALAAIERSGEPMSTVAAWCGVNAGSFREIVNGKQTAIRFGTAVKIKGLEEE